jgi:peptidyl-prolyl cis-trans isomerase SurA
MKKIISILVLSMSCIAAFAKPAPQSLDQIVAIVNDDVVTKSELNRAMDTVKMTMSQQNMATPDSKVMQKQVLTQLINKKLQLQIARQAGIEATDEELDKAIDNIAKQNNVTVSALYEQLDKEGMAKKEYRNELRDQITMQKLQQQEVNGKVSVSQDEISSFIHSHAWQANAEKEYHLEDILIPVSDTPSSEEVVAAKKRADLAMNRLNKGESFAVVSQSESGSKNALQGGDLGWRKLPEIPSAFADQVTRMKVQQVAGPIQTPNGFHIIRLADMRADATPKAAPNRKQIQDQLMQQKYEVIVQNWVSKLRNQAFIVTNPTS